MIIEALAGLFTRDLDKVRTEIVAYKDQDKIWAIEKGISNSAGNLCLHLTGNLKTYIGDGIGHIPYVRNRDLEFSAKDVPLSTLLDDIDQTSIIVKKAILGLMPADLEKDFPIVIWEQPTKMDLTLLHLLSHLNYHLGQVNYHRRLIDV